MIPGLRVIQFWRTLEQHVVRYSRPRRGFCCSCFTKSGHNRWSKIKHDKAHTDALKTKQRTALAKDIAAASKSHGPDPSINPALALAIANAKRANYPKASIESAIARGQGRSSTGAPLESLTLEAVIPPGIGVIVDCETDSKARALSDLRLLIKNHGGSATPSAFLFQRRGRVLFEDGGDGKGLEEIFSAALEAGPVEDVTWDEDGSIVVDTTPENVKEVEKTVLQEVGLEAKRLEVVWTPIDHTMVRDVDSDVLDRLHKLHDELQEYPGVQSVYLNVDFSPEPFAIDLRKD